MDIIPRAKSAKRPLSATPKLPRSNTEKEAPSWKASRIWDPMPCTLSDTKSMMVSAVRMPAPTTSPTIWFGLRADAKSPMANVAAA